MFVVFVQSQNCGGGGTIDPSAGGITVNGVTMSQTSAGSMDHYSETYLSWFVAAVAVAVAVAGSSISNYLVAYEVLEAELLKRFECRN